jgi:hypothetical protein
MQTFVLKDRIPSSSHNATGEDENGMFWPSGTRFKKLPPERTKFWTTRYGDYVGKVFLEQIGGEEVVVVVDEAFFKAHFVQEAPRLMLFGVEEVNVGAVVITAD